MNSEIMSPIFSDPLSPTSASHSLISDYHSRNLSAGTNDHARNLSGGTTVSSALHEQVGYSGAPEI